MSPKNAFKCPITAEVMVDPVVDHEGNTYERRAIEDWLARQTTSPITRNPLTVAQLTPNRALKDLIAASKEKKKKKGKNDDDDASSSSSDSDSDSDDEVVDDGVVRPVVPEEPAPEVSPTLRFVASRGTKKSDAMSLVAVDVPDDPTDRRAGAEVVCVIDVSFSMDAKAKMHGDEGSSGLSVLDIVKHATRTIVETMGPRDRLALVSYADQARVEQEFVKMTPENRRMASMVVSSLRTRGSTNLWDGLYQALELGRRTKRETNVLLLTDGMPNHHPPRGELPTFVKYLSKNPNARCRVSTFGFGYNLDSDLLNNLACSGGGFYGFIPDSSFVGTVFINAAANVLSAIRTPTPLSLTVKVPGRISSKTTTTPLPALSYGQSYHVLLRNAAVDYKSVALTGRGTNGSTVTLASLDRKDMVFGDEVGDRDLVVADVRDRLVALLRGNQDILNAKYNVQDVPAERERRFADVRKRTAALLTNVDEILASGVDDERLRGLREDLAGQITEAFSCFDYHDRWGRHYALSLARAHELQICTNFKDHGLQTYAATKFSLIRDAAEDLFQSLPPPTPSLPARRGDGGGGTLGKGGAPSPAPVVNMKSYLDSSAPCLAEGSVVLVVPKYGGGAARETDVAEVRRGDVLRASSASDANVVVRCVVVTVCGDDQPLVDLGGRLVVTPWHPVRRNGGEWTFPADDEGAALVRYARPGERVVSLVLEAPAHAFAVGDGGLREAVSLGHGRSEGILRHDYLGTRRVVDDLSTMPGWDEGEVRLGPNPAVRDPSTGRVVAYRRPAATTIAA